MQKTVGISWMVQVYVADIANLKDPLEHPHQMEGLSEERKQKIMRQRRLLGRKQRLGAGLLLKQALFFCGVAEGEINIAEHGKPEMNHICFNLSHSQDLVVCAVSTKPVGVDIEKIACAPEKIAKRFFTPREVEYINSEEDFYRLWTMKESYIKMTGEGMHLPLEQFEIRIEEPIKIYRGNKRCDCFIKEYQIPGYKLTVCAEEEEFSSQVEYVSMEKYGGS